MNSLFALIISTATLGAPPEAAAPDPKLTALVQQLGHKSFAVREAAARDLVKAGTQAVRALTDGMKDKDTEVAERCKQLLPAAVDAERNKLLARLLKEPAAPPPNGLAGLAKFLDITGDDKAARQLYAEMMAAHAPIVEALEANPTAAARLLTEFAKQSLDRVRVAEQLGQDPYAAFLTCRGEVALFFFVRGDSRFDTMTGDRETMLLLCSSRLKTDLVGPVAVPGMKKLFLHWLATEKQEDEVLTAFEIAAEAKMTEALPLALKAVNDTRKGSCYRASLMLDFLAVAGGKEHVKSLEPMLADQSTLGSLRLGVDGQILVPQLRDVALAVSIRMAGQKPADFGFHTDGFENQAYHKYFGGYGFKNAAARNTALAKWQAWVKRQETPEKK